MVQNEEETIEMETPTLDSVSKDKNRINQIFSF